MNPTELESAAVVDQLGLADEVVDVETRDRAVGRFREQGIVLPTFAQLADPSLLPAEAMGAVDKDAADPRNLFRVHWHNDLEGRRTEVPDHLVLPRELTGVECPIVVVFGDRFPMIAAHKVLAAYACLAPRVITGQFDPTRQRAIWPSTGNYARGGVAISRIMGCRGIAVLPAGMSQERFDWLDRWVAEPGDIIRTPGTESNVKEIYDACRELAADPANLVLNQFSELGNHLADYEITGRALAWTFEQVAAVLDRPGLRLAAFVSATGSAGTIGAGDRLKDHYGTKVVAVEALECPTMLENGFGEHNIQGIGDKHIPLIHNVMNTDVVCAVSDRATDALDVLFNTPEGRAHLVHRCQVPEEVLAALGHLGLSSICNVVAAIKVARRLDLGPEDAIVTVATDGAALYGSERRKTLDRRFGGRFTALDAAEVHAEHLAAAGADHVLECTERERTRIFNLGYYTWVEQQGTPLEVFEARRSQAFWRGLRRYLPVWDELIDEFNGRVATGAGVTALPADLAERAVASMVLGWRCGGCGLELDVAAALPWRCPNATRTDRHHVLQIVRRPGPLQLDPDPDPLLAYGRELAWQGFALARGMTADACAALVRQLGDRVAAVCGGVRFASTPFGRAGVLSDALDFAPDGGVWVKDETGNVAGSHKARHLVSILLHLKAAELLGVGPRDDRLAIASCGNAALAAAVLAAADHRELEVFVPPTADPTLVAELVRLRAIVTECPRGPTEAPGDPCVHRFRDAVDAGAIPFSVQGPENALSLDAGRTLGWEMVAGTGVELDRLFVQVGGGALAACVGRAVIEAGCRPRVHAVQTEGCAPVARAWEHALEIGVPLAGARWGECMWPWERQPRSVAEGILDDETYDWLGVVEAMDETGGDPIVAREASIVQAYELGARTTGIPASPTGTAGLAGLLERRSQIDAGERVAVVFSGIAR